MGFFDLLNIGLDVAKVALSNKPIGAILHVVDEVVRKKADGISNESIIDTLERMGKSSWNSLNVEKIEEIKNILND